MTPTTPMPIPTPKSGLSVSTSNGADPPLAKSPVEIVANSPAFYQSMRNKKRLAVLEQFNDHSSADGGPPGSTTKSLPRLNTTPLFNRTKDSKLRTPFKVPFIDRLKNAATYE